MNRFLRLVFVVVLLFSVYHLIRDSLQIAGLNNVLSTFLHRPHLWCKPYCDYITYSLEIWGIIGSTLVLKNNRLGLTGILVLISLPFWVLMALLP